MELLKHCSWFDRRDRIDGALNRQLWYIRTSWVHRCIMSTGQRIVSDFPEYYLKISSYFLPFYFKLNLIDWFNLNLKANRIQIIRLQRHFPVTQSGLLCNYINLINIKQQIIHPNNVRFPKSWSRTNISDLGLCRHVCPRTICTGI